MRFTARLEATDGSGHFRRSTVFADSEQEARAFLDRQERKKTDFRLTTVELDEIVDRACPQADGETPDDYEKRRARFARSILEVGPGDITKANTPEWDSLTNAERSKVAVHRQAAPYEIVYVGLTEPPRDPARKPGGAAAAKASKGGE